jgi:hypothetical protein
MKIDRMNASTMSCKNHKSSSWLQLLHVCNLKDVQLQITFDYMKIQLHDYDYPISGVHYYIFISRDDPYWLWGSKVKLDIGIYWPLNIFKTHGHQTSYTSTHWNMYILKNQWPLLILRSRVKLDIEIYQLLNILKTPCVMDIILNTLIHFKKRKNEGIDVSYWFWG